MNRRNVNSGTVSRRWTGLPLLPGALEVIEGLFDRVPDTVFFVKDESGRYTAVNCTLVERCGLREKAQLLGKTVEQVFPPELAARYAAQDAAVLASGREIVERLELHWHAGHRSGWCLTTKLPLRDAAGRVVGLAGISRDLRSPREAGRAPPGLLRALDSLERSPGSAVTPARLARRAGLSPVRFARIIKRLLKVTPGQLITQTRLSAASRLLEESDLSVAEVAVASGFYDHSAFTRAFRRETGLTPSAYRAARRAQGGRRGS